MGRPSDHDVQWVIIVMGVFCAVLLGSTRYQKLQLSHNTCQCKGKTDITQALTSFYGVDITLPFRGENHRQSEFPIYKAHLPTKLAHPQNSGIVYSKVGTGKTAFTSDIKHDGLHIRIHQNEMNQIMSNLADDVCSTTKRCRAYVKENFDAPVFNSILMFFAVESFLDHFEGMRPNERLRALRKAFPHQERGAGDVRRFLALVFLHFRITKSQLPRQASYAEWVEFVMKNTKALSTFNPDERNGWLGKAPTRMDLDCVLEMHTMTTRPQFKFFGESDKNTGKFLHEFCREDNYPVQNLANVRHAVDAFGGDLPYFMDKIRLLSGQNSPLLVTVDGFDEIELLNCRPLKQWNTEECEGANFRMMKAALNEHFLGVGRAGRVKGVPGEHDSLILQYRLTFSTLSNTTLSDVQSWVAEGKVNVDEIPWKGRDIEDFVREQWKYVVDHFSYFKTEKNSCSNLPEWDKWVAGTQISAYLHELRTPRSAKAFMEALISANVKQWKRRLANEKLSSWETLYRMFLGYTPRRKIPMELLPDALKETWEENCLLLHQTQREERPVGEFCKVPTDW